MWAAAEGHAGVVRFARRGRCRRQGRGRRADSRRCCSPRAKGRSRRSRALLEAGASVEESVAVSSPESAGGVEQRTARGWSQRTSSASRATPTSSLPRSCSTAAPIPTAAPRRWTALHQVSWVRKIGDAGGNDPPPARLGARWGACEFVRKPSSLHGATSTRASPRGRLPVGAIGTEFPGATPFLLAARTADIELMRCCSRLGADPLAADRSGTTPLMVAAGVGAALPGEEPGTEAEALEAVKTGAEARRRS